MFRKTILALGAILLSTSFVHAAPIQVVTEGTRPTVLGSTDDINDTNGPAGFTLDTLSNVGDYIDIHGRIVGAIDYFNFTSTTAFTIDWIFGGYDIDGSSVSESGFVREGGNDNAVDFYLLGAGPAIEAPGNSFMTNIISEVDNGGNSQIFPTLGPGSYTLKIDNDSPSGAALYDVRISAVPLPAGAVLLLTGLGIMGATRLRRKA